MSFSIEKIITLELFCWKCKEQLIRYTKELIVGSCALYECPKCHCIILIKEAETCVFELGNIPKKTSDTDEILADIEKIKSKILRNF